MESKSLREQCWKRWTDLKSERSSWMPHWQEISNVLLPRAGRFLVSENNKGYKRHHEILDNTGTRALRTLAGGMMAGMTSPARPWFRLTTKDPKLDETYNVKSWMSEVTTLMQMVYTKSNVYRALQMAYEELGAFGTTATILLDDDDRLIHCMPLTIGEYAIATGPRGAINTLYREFRMSVAALVEEFGYENVSSSVRQLYDKGNYDAWIEVVNAIEPRTYRDTSKIDNKNMPIRSIYFESGNGGSKILRETGFKQFPVLGARWSVTGGDIYGVSPGMEALGDLRQLQQEQLCKSKAIAYQADPPIIAPVELKNGDLDLVPGGISYADSVAQAQTIRSGFDVNLNLNALLMDIQDVRNRINEAFYKDIFLMIANNSDKTMTATEVAERHEEKMLMLGPVLERLNAELLDPLISMTFERLVTEDLLPPLPEELHGVDLNVEFISILAQAQRSIATNAIDRFTNNLGVLANIKPEILDKFDSDQWADIYSDALGIDPRLIVSGKQVALIRQQRAEAQQQQAQMEQAQQMASVAKDLGSAQGGLQGDLMSSSGGDMMSQFMGY